MKPEAIASVAIALLMSSPGALAQFVKGNEAVRLESNGSKSVETPPLPSATLAAPCPAARAGCAGGGWKMVEKTVIDLQAHAIGRDRGIDYGVQDFLEGTKREQFQDDFRKELGEWTKPGSYLKFSGNA